MTGQQWTMLLLLGLLLTVISLPVSDSKKEKRTRSGILEEAEEDMTDRTELEAKLESILENTEGAGQVQVLLMTGQQQGFYGSGKIEVTGVLISAEGADDPVIVRNIQQAVMALFQIEAHKIKIMKMK
ncbi:MAG: hypothetical protein ACOYBB_13420 [Blautia sp.]|uniref:hypothetical protein n=1 Tax=Blautia sp. TaxID=1955243 RepID=UPI003AB2C0F9